MMDELNKKIHTLKKGIRMAINESGLALGVVELALDSIRAEILQNELFIANSELANVQEQPVEESEVKADGIHEDNVGE